jgi:hypothetical protein
MWRESQVVMQGKPKALMASMRKHACASTEKM